MNNRRRSSSSSSAEFRVFNVIVLGPALSGKTWLINRLIGEDLPNSYRSSIEKFYGVTELMHKESLLEVEYREVTTDYTDKLYEIYLNSADLVIVTVDKTRPDTVNKSIQMISDIINNKDVELITVSTKSDVDSQLSDEVIPAIKRIKHIATSSLLYNGISYLLEMISSSLVKISKQEQGGFLVNLRSRYSFSKRRKSLHKSLKLATEKQDESASLSATITDCAERFRKISPYVFCSLGLQEQPSQIIEDIARERRFQHLCHIIEVPPIVFDQYVDEDDTILTRARGWMNRLTKRFSQ